MRADHWLNLRTYDLHGQWDHGNPNAFDNCDSGKCIRSHVNLTETRNALGMVTKAGVPTNKIFVGESSYGRSFHMAEPGCWAEMCEFTGSRVRSDANPGRCTNTGGYLANAEIAEILMLGGGEVEGFHDGKSNTDVLPYKGDYVSYMTTTTKDTRRASWKRLNFAGSIDWALDLQSFSSSDTDPPTDLPEEGEEACQDGYDATLYSGDICEFTCHLGFCPDSFCECTANGPRRSLPRAVDIPDVTAVAEDSVVINQLCKFACRYGYCPSDVCVQGEGPGIIEDEEGVKQPDRGSLAECVTFKDLDLRDVSVNHCRNYCDAAVREAIEEGRTTNYGCLGIAVDGVIPWTELEGSGLGEGAPGRCLCDNFLINEIVDSVIEALPIIAQIGCAILMQSLKFVIDIGLAAFPPGRALHAGLDMLATAAQTVNYIYPEGEDPSGAFDWWLSPCGGDDLLPEEVRQAFDIMSLLSGDVGSFKRPGNIKQGSGKKGDDGNPNDQSTPRSTNNNNNNQNQVQCRTPGRVYDAVRQYRNVGANVVSRRTCGRDRTWTTNLYTAASISYPANGRERLSIGTCAGGITAAACRHYSSAISVSPAYQSVTCAQAQATAGPDRNDGPHVRRWYTEHDGAGWRDKQHIAWQGRQCEVDEYPPAYLLGADAMRPAGAQLVRYIPDEANGAGGRMFKGWCLRGGVEALSDDDSVVRVKNVGRSDIDRNNRGVTTKWTATIDVDVTPVFSIGVWQHQVLPNDGLDDNECWPSGIAPGDPGFALLNNDPYNLGRQRPNYNYRQQYVAGVNGV